MNTGEHWTGPLVRIVLVLSCIFSVSYELRYANAHQKSLDQHFWIVQMNWRGSINCTVFGFCELLLCCREMEKLICITPDHVYCLVYSSVCGLFYGIWKFGKFFENTQKTHCCPED